MQVLGGKAFLEHLQEPEALPGQVTSTFTLHINFRGQRFLSRPTACACEPDIQEGFLLELHKESAGYFLSHFFKNEYVSLRLRVQNAVPAQPCVGKLGISLVLLNFLHCNFRLWFKTP